MILYMLHNVVVHVVDFIVFVFNYYIIFKKYNTNNIQNECSIVENVTYLQVESI